MELFQIAFLSTYFIWLAWIAKDDWNTGWIPKWKLWVLVGMGIVYGLLFIHDLPITFNLSVLVLIGIMHFFGKVPFADVVAIGSVASFFPHLFMWVCGASFLAAFIYMTVKRTKELRFIPLVYLTLVFCLIIYHFL